MTALECQARGLGFILGSGMRSNLASYEDLCAVWGRVERSGCGPGPGMKVDSLPSEPPGMPMNTGVGTLTLLQMIFPTQELNQGLLHCRWILY